MFMIYAYEMISNGKKKKEKKDFDNFMFERKDYHCT